MPESWSELLGFLTLSRVKQSSNCCKLKLTGVFKGPIYQIAHLEASVHQYTSPSAIRHLRRGICKQVRASRVAGTTHMPDAV